MSHPDSCLCETCAALNCANRAERERDELKAKLATAEEDTRLLDWAEAHPDEIQWDIGGWYIRGNVDYSLRKALRAALEREKEKGTDETTEN